MKTALVLSGGGSRGAYEIGVYQALLDMDVKVDMVVGTSIGAMNAYIIAQGKFEVAKKLWLTLRTEDVFDMSEAESGIPSGDDAYEAESSQKSKSKTKEKKSSIAKKLRGRRTGRSVSGASFTEIKEVLEAELSEDAVRKSAMDFGLCTVQIPTSKDRDSVSEAIKDPAVPLELGDLKRLKPTVEKLWKEDIPEGRMLDYVFASCSIIPITVPYEIDGKTYIDGGFADAMPISMALDRQAERIIAVNLEAVGRVRYFDIAVADLTENLVMITPSKPLGNIAEFDPENSKRIMHMGYIDTLRTFKKKGLV